MVDYDFSLRPLRIPWRALREPFCQYCQKKVSRKDHKEKTVKHAKKTRQLPRSPINQEFITFVLLK